MTTFYKVSIISIFGDAGRMGICLADMIWTVHEMLDRVAGELMHLFVDVCNTILVGVLGFLDEARLHR